MKRMKRFLPVFAVVFAMLVVAAGVLTVNVRAKESEDDTVPDRVYFGEIDGGGLTQAEAEAAIDEYVNKIATSRITLQAGNNTIEVAASELGLAWSNREIVEEAAGLLKSGNLISRYKAMKDLEHENKVYHISYSVDPQKVASVIESNGEQLNTQAVDAGLKRESSGFVIVPGSQGVTVNVEESIKEIENFFSADWNEQNGTIGLAADVVDPRGTEEELSKVKDVLGTFNTGYGSSAAGRAQNVARGAELINASVVYPGEEFSVYDSVEPFNKDNGYELAGSYENGTTVQTYGGGICQVSTTLYNAVIRAELEVTERYAHSMTVNYVKPSADAAIAGTYKNLRFKNNTNAPIYIEGYTSNRELYFTIYGEETRPANRTIEYVSETTSVTEASVEYKAVGQPIGYKSTEQSSHTGKTAELWKIVYIDGVEESREKVNSSTYKASNTIISVGIASAVPEASAAVNSAVASQSGGAIDAAIAQWSNSAIAARQQAEADAAAAQAQAEADAAAAAAQEQEPDQQQPLDETPKPDDGDQEEDPPEEQEEEPQE